MVIVGVQVNLRLHLHVPHCPLPQPQHQDHAHQEEVGWQLHGRSIWTCGTALLLTYSALVARTPFTVFTKSSLDLPSHIQADHIVVPGHCLKKLLKLSKETYSINT